MSHSPEQLAREEIDALLSHAGWVLQDKKDFDRHASEGVAVREFPPPNGECDYLLFVGGKRRHHRGEESWNNAQRR